MSIVCVCIGDEYSSDKRYRRFVFVLLSFCFGKRKLATGGPGQEDH